MDIFHQMSPEGGLSESACLINCDPCSVGHTLDSITCCSLTQLIAWARAIYRWLILDLRVLQGNSSQSLSLYLWREPAIPTPLFSINWRDALREFWFQRLISKLLVPFLRSSRRLRWNISASIEVQRLNFFFHVKQNVIKKLNEMGVIREAKDIIKSFQIMCNARSKTQLRSWVQHFRDRYVDSGDNVQRFFEYLTEPNGYLNLDSWQSLWTRVPVEEDHAEEYLNNSTLKRVLIT